MMRDAPRLNQAGRPTPLIRKRTLRPLHLDQKQRAERMTRPRILHKRLETKNLKLENIQGLMTLNCALILAVISINRDTLAPK